MQLSGTGVALVTPFNQDLSIDYVGLKSLIDHVIQGGVNYLVSLGTTGESACLTQEEKQEVLNKTVEFTKNRVPVIAGFGGNNTSAVLKDLSTYNLNGISGILSVSPYYNKPTQEGIFAHYAAIAKASPLPIILYNVPSRTASNLTASTTIKLARTFDNIVAIKEASGDLIQCMEIVQNRPDDFSVISGDDPLTLPMISFGMHGVISVAANAFPRIFSEMVQKGVEGNFGPALTQHYQLFDLFNLLFIEGNPAGVKSALKTLGICNDYVRMPLIKCSKELETKISATIKLIRS